MKLVKETVPDAIVETETKLEITVDRIFRPHFDHVAREIKAWLGKKPH